MVKLLYFILGKLVKLVEIIKDLSKFGKNLGKIWQKIKIGSVCNFGLRMSSVSQKLKTLFCFILPIFIHFYQFLPISTNFYQFYQFLPIFN